MGGGGNVGIALGNQLMVTDHGLTGFSDLKVDPGMQEICSFIMSSLKSLVTYLPTKRYSAIVHWIGCVNAIKLQI